MSLNVQRLVLASTGTNAGMKTTTDTAGDPLIVNGPQLWTYESATDNLATIAAANYFSDKAFAMSVGDFIIATGSDASNLYIVDAVSTSVTPNTISIVSFSTSGVVATANIQDNAVTTVKIADANVTLAKLAAGITMSHVVKYAGQPTTVGGGAAEAITVTGAAATDLAFVQLVNAGTNVVSVVKAVVTLNTLTVTFSADPGADAVVNYQLLRAAV